MKTDNLGNPLHSSILVDESGGTPHSEDTDGQAVIFMKARNYVWDAVGLTWVRETQPGTSGGGGPATTVDQGTGGASAWLVAGTITSNQGGAPWTQRIQDGVGSTLATVTAGNALKVDGSAVTQPVSGTFWQATQPVSIAATVTADITDRSARLLGHVTVDNASIAVTGTFWQATQPVSEATLDATIVAQGTTAPTKILVVGGKSNDVTAQYKELPLGAAARSVIVEGFAGGTAVPVSGTFWQATQPVSGTVTANIGTTNGLALDATLAKLNIAQGTALGANTGPLLQGSVTTAAPTYTTGNINPLSLTTAGALRVDGSGVTQPVSGTFWQATQPVSGTVTANQGTANATPWNENVAQVGGTNVVTSLAGALGVGGDTADGAADAGKSLKVGGKVTLNNAALPTALTASQRGPVMVDEYGRFRIIPNRPKIVGLYFFESGRLTVQASAHAATAGFFWLINPVGSSVVVYLKKLIVSSSPTAVTAFASAPRLTVERVTFTGTASGAQITAAKRDSNDATPTATVRTASTGLTLTAGAIIGDYTVPAVLTAAGIAVPIDQILYEAKGDEDDLLVLRAGEGIVFRQPDAGTTSDTRLITVTGAWEER